MRNVFLAEAETASLFEEPEDREAAPVRGPWSAARRGAPNGRNSRVPPLNLPKIEASGMTREEQRRFRAYIAAKPPAAPRNVLPTTSWMDWPYPDTPTRPRSC